MVPATVDALSGSATQLTIFSTIHSRILAAAALVHNVGQSLEIF